MTKDEIQAAMPAHVRKNITQPLVDHINQWLAKADTDEAQLYRDNILTYSKVLSEGKYKVSDYMAACMYVAYRNMGYNKLESWSRVFPDRYQKLKQKNKTAKDISASYSAYDSTSLVQKIYEKAMMPIRITHRDYLYRALKVSAEIMEDDTVSARDRVAASKNVMDLLKDDEKATKVELDITPVASSTMQGLADAMKSLAARQIEAQKQGLLSARDITETAVVIEHEESN